MVLEARGLSWRVGLHMQVEQIYYGAGFYLNLSE